MASRTNLYNWSLASLATISIDINWPYLNLPSIIYQVMQEGASACKRHHVKSECLRHIVRITFFPFTYQYALHPGCLHLSRVLPLLCFSQPLSHPSCEKKAYWHLFEPFLCSASAALSWKPTNLAQDPMIRARLPAHELPWRGCSVRSHQPDFLSPWCQITPTMAYLTPTPYSRKPLGDDGW